jgi:hypothetical protein
VTGRDRVRDVAIDAGDARDLARRTHDAELIAYEQRDL